MKESSVQVEAVVLAGGYSSRAGAFKMTLPLGNTGRTLLQYTIERILPSCSRVIVVGGFRIDEIIRVMGGYRDVQVVENPGFHSGMFSSVQVGVRHVTAGWFFILPGDYPLVQSDTFAKLLETAALGKDSMVPRVFIPVFNGKKGHPILVNQWLVQHILEEPIDSSLKQVISRTGFVPVPVADPGIHMDVDTPGDYNNILQYTIT